MTVGSESLFQVNPFFGVLRQDLTKQPGWPGTQSPSASASAVLGSLCAVAVASSALALKRDSDQQSSSSQTGGRQQRNDPFGLSHRDLGAVTVTAFIMTDTSAWPPTSTCEALCSRTEVPDTGGLVGDVTQWYTFSGVSYLALTVNLIQPH